jgi:hypothetical protein
MMSGRSPSFWRLLKFAKQVEPDHLVVERLVEIAQKSPEQCIDPLMLMIEGDAKGVGVVNFGWKGRGEGNNSSRKKIRKFRGAIRGRGIGEYAGDKRPF